MPSYTDLMPRGHQRSLHSWRLLQRPYAAAISAFWRDAWARIAVVSGRARPTTDTSPDSRQAAGWCEDFPLNIWS